MKTLTLLASGILCAALTISTSFAQAPHRDECRPFFHFPRSNAPTSYWTVKSLCQAYQFPTGLTGGGVIGILELGGGYSQTDLDSFSQLNGMPKITVTSVSVNGGKNN